MGADVEDLVDEVVRPALPCPAERQGEELPDPPRPTVDGEALDDVGSAWVHRELRVEAAVGLREGDDLRSVAAQVAPVSTPCEKPRIAPGPPLGNGGGAPAPTPTGDMAQAPFSHLGREVAWARDGPVP